MKKKIILIIGLLFIFIISVSAQKSPDGFFNLTIGADKTLVAYPEIIKYFKYLDKGSDLIKLSYEGDSTLKNKMYVAFISSSSNIKNLDKLISINKKLANPDTVGKDEVETLINKAKTFVLITATIHSTEVASSQYVMKLAHELAVTTDSSLKKIMDNVVIMIMPSINPDGNILVTDWYNKYLNTKYEGSRIPYLYHHYAGHDTNRDFYMLNLKETLVVNDVLHHKYFPQIFLDMHQMGSTGPRMFVPPFKDPINQNLDPLLLTQTSMIGSFMAFKLQEKNKKGVASSYAFDAYWPGGSKNTAWYKNVVGLLSELASVNIASPIFIDQNELKVRSKGLAEYKAQVNFPDPWKGGWWRLKDIIEYEDIAVKALIELASKNRKSFISNFYRLGLKSIKTGETEKPYAYIIPVTQWDTPASYTFMQKIKRNGIQVYKLLKDSIIDNKFYKKNSFVIPMDQPYRSFIKVMMEIQKYPEIKHMKDGPIIEPYDASGWTMPIQMGVKYEEINSVIDKKLIKRIDKLDYPDSVIRTTEKYYSISAKFNRSAIIVNRLHKKKIKVYRSIDKSTNIGDFIFNKNDIDQITLKQILEGTGINISPVKVKKENLIRLNPPSIAIYQAHSSSMDEGWTRWVLDNFGFSYKILHPEDIRKPKILKNIDVIIFADMRRKKIVEGKGRWGRSQINLRNTKMELVKKELKS